MASEHEGVLLRLEDILAAITGILGTVGGLDFDTYVAVWSVRRASERGIEIISEASRYIPDEMKHSEPQIPWRQIAGIGNVLRHGYESISDRVVWDIIKAHLEPLDAAVRRLKERVERERMPAGMKQ